jgi:hypothetical protein
MSVEDWSFGPTRDGLDQVWASEANAGAGVVARGSRTYTLRCEGASLTEGITTGWMIHQPRLPLSDILEELRFIETDLR